MLISFLFKHNAAYEMRISDGSSDVCSTTLLPRLLRGSGARHQTVPIHNPRNAARQGPVGIKRCGEPCQTVQRNAAVSQPSLEQFGTKPHRVKARLLPSDPLKIGRAHV